MPCGTYNYTRGIADYEKLECSKEPKNIKWNDLGNDSLNNGWDAVANKNITERKYTYLTDNTKAVQETGRSVDTSNRPYPRHMSDVMMTKYEGKMKETAEKFAYCSLVETENIKLDTTEQRNFAERMRRSTMNEKFFNLQQCIPDIASKKKISKLDIIRSAVVYIKSLEQEERLYMQMKAVEEQRNKQLFMKLYQLSIT